MYRILEMHSYAISFYGYPSAGKFLQAPRKAGFRTVGPFVFTKTYNSSQYHVGYRHECAYLLAKGSPTPQEVISWQQTAFHAETAFHPETADLSVQRTK